MLRTSIWFLALFNILLVFCLTPPPRIYSLDFNDGKDELVVKWTMNNPKHSFKNFGIDLITHSWNSSSCKSSKCVSFKTVDVDYEYKFPSKYLPASTFIGRVTSCNNDSCTNCKLSSDEYYMITPPFKPEISAKIEICNDEVCSFHVQINEAIKDSKLYVLEKQKAEKWNLTNSAESIIFLNESSIHVLNVTTSINFKIDKSKHCGNQISLIAVNTFKRSFSFSDIRQYTIPACNSQYVELIVLILISLIVALLVVLIVCVRSRNRDERGNSAEGRVVIMKNLETNSEFALILLNK